MAPEVDPNINPLIWTAIEKKRLLRFRYKNRERIVEPHDYGIHKSLIKLFGYQAKSGESKGVGVFVEYLDGRKVFMGGSAPGADGRGSTPQTPR